MSKLTLSVDEDVVERAKRYAANRGTSVSRLVEQYLGLVTRPSSMVEDGLSPILGRLRAELKGVSVDRADYDKYRERKYR